MRWPNDWQLKYCLWLCGGVTLLQLALVSLAQSGVDIPVIRQAGGFIFLSFVPGILLLRILRIHGINMVESAVYSVGLSLAALMFAGTAVNFILPPLGIHQPLSTIPLILSIAALTAVLMAAAWASDRRTTPPDALRISLLPSLNSSLFLLLILLLIVLGVKLSDLSGNNLLLILSLLLVALTVGLGAYRKLITPEIYPLAILIISLCLIYQTTLLSPFPMGTDVYAEYQYYRITAEAGFWDHTLPSTINSCPSIVILAPLYSGALGISGIWTFKAVYPLLFSFMPLALYRIFRIQTGEARSFLATFFFMAVPTFSLEMIGLCRQQVAELFMALFILLLVDRRLGNLPKLIMILVFSVSIAISHYSLGFINFIYAGLLLVFMGIMKSDFFRRAWGWLTRRTGGLPDYISRPGSGSLPAWLIAIPVVFYFVAALTWFSLTASGIDMAILIQQWTSHVGSIGQTLRNLANRALSVVGSGAPSPGDPLIRAALGLDFFQSSWQGKVFRILQYITQLFIAAGCLRLLFRPRGLKFSPEYIALSVISVLLLVACVTLPYLSAVFNTSRWYHILLITLAPYCILGGEAVILCIRWLWSRLRKMQPAGYFDAASGPALSLITVIVLIPYFIFTSGIVYEVTGQQVTDRVDNPYSLALSNYRLNFTGIFNRQDLAAAQWLCGHSGDGGIKVYTDANSYKMLLIPQCNMGWDYIPPDESLPASTFLYLTAWNNDNGKIAFSQNRRPGLRQFVNIDELAGLKSTIASGDAIYNNGGASLLLAR